MLLSSTQIFIQINLWFFSKNVFCMSCSSFKDSPSMVQADTLPSEKELYESYPTILQLS